MKRQLLYTICSLFLIFSGMGASRSFSEALSELTESGAHIGTGTYSYGDIYALTTQNKIDKAACRESVSVIRHPSCGLYTTEQFSVCARMQNAIAILSHTPIGTFLRHRYLLLTILLQSLF